jgi:hypothetical protein
MNILQRTLIAGAVIVGAFASHVIGQTRAETVTSHYGARASVSPKYAARFQGLIRDLEAHGAAIRFMGGYRSGVCGQASKHPCGMALDICQLSRGVVDRACHLPGRREVSAIASRHRLFSGGDWCSSDYGHFEAGGSVACGHSWASHGGYHEGSSFGRASGRAGGHAGARVEASAWRGPGSSDFH